MLVGLRAVSHRKPCFDLALVDLGSTLASAEARLPNHLVAETLAQGRLYHFAGYPKVRPEVAFGKSCLDFMLEGPEGRCYLETKSVTLVVDGVGLFPGAPTTRGPSTSAVWRRWWRPGTEPRWCS